MADAAPYQHPSLFVGKFEDQLGVFIRDGEEDIQPGTVVLRSVVLAKDEDGEHTHRQRCMAIALQLRSADADEVEALYPREKEISEDEAFRKPVVAEAEKLMDEEPKWDADGVDFSTMTPEERSKMAWLFEKALNNMFHTPHGGFVFKGMGHSLNHSCMPNAVWTVDPNAGELTVKTVKSIEGQEELTIGYFAIRDSKVDMFSELGDYYNFTCHCDSCMMVYRMIEPERFPPDEDRKITIEKPLRFSQMPYLVNWYQTTCTWCGKRPGKLLSCSKCQAARFCNRECQAADWNALHKGFCATMKEWRETGVLLKAAADTV